MQQETDNMNTKTFKALMLLTLWMIVLSLPSSGTASSKSATASTEAASQDPPARFHHVRLNVTDPKASVEYYQKFFSAVPIKFRGVSDALLTNRSFILFNTVPKRASNNSRTALWHIGWGGIDGPSEYSWRNAQGMQWAKDLVTVGDNLVHFMYASGPDQEIVEIWTGTPYQRYNHVHLLANDPNVTRDWYIDNLGARGDKKYIPNPGLPPPSMTFRDDPKKLFAAIWNTVAVVDGVIFNIFGIPSEPVFWWDDGLIDKFEKTEGHVINHFAFSYPDIEPVYKRMKKNGVTIVKGIRWDKKLKMKSFFVRAPDNVLVEIVEADPIPDASWLRHIQSRYE